MRHESDPDEPNAPSLYAEAGGMLLAEGLEVLRAVHRGLFGK
ncbi:MAG: hypothetical protein AAGA56_10740 [Myxococcota bacterium]